MMRILSLCVALGLTLAVATSSGLAQSTSGRDVAGEQASIALSFPGNTILVEVDTPQPARTWLVTGEGQTIVVETTAELTPADVPIRHGGLLRLTVGPRAEGGSRIVMTLDHPMVAQLTAGSGSSTRAVVALAQPPRTSPEATTPPALPAPGSAAPRASSTGALPLGGPMRPAALPATGSTIDLRPGEGQLVSTPGLERVAVSNPKVADVVTVSSDQLLIDAHTAGVTSLWLWLTGRGAYQYTVRVSGDETDRERVVNLLGRAGDPATVHVSWVGNALVLTGTVATQVIRDQLDGMAQAAVKGIQNATVVDQIAVTHPIQYRIEVRIVELENSAFKDIGINWGMFWQGVVQNTVTAPNGTTSTVFQPTPSGVPCQLGLPPAGGVGAPGAGIGSSVAQGCFSLPQLFLFGVTSGGITTLNGAQFFAQLVPLIRTGKADVLAAPNVVTLAGKQAQIVIGGQLPLPGGNGQISYQPYGVVIKLTPVTNGDDQLYLTLDASYSQPDFVHTIGVQGSSLPTLTDRHVTTELSLRSGQTFAIGGMISHVTSNELTKVPLLGDIPILGALFQHKNFQDNKSEVLFFITPQVVE